MADENNSKLKVNLSLDLRIIVIVLLAVIVGMLLAWKPWSSGEASDRTVDVQGEAKVSAEPDEYVFYPSYQFSSANKDAALTELTAKSDTVVNKLKELGVADKDIKTDSSGYDYPVLKEPSSEDTTYSLQLTVTVSDKELAQKVQDYLVTTSPTGSVSPQPTFSDAKRKELEAQARDEATKDARTKADQMASNLGFKVGKVKTVSDSGGFGSYPMPAIAVDNMSGSSSSRELALQPGENDLTYYVSVTYYLK